MGQGWADCGGAWASLRGGVQDVPKLLAALRRALERDAAFFQGLEELTERSYAAKVIRRAFGRARAIRGAAVCDAIRVDACPDGEALGCIRALLAFWFTFFCDALVANRLVRFDGTGADHYLGRTVGSVDV